MNPTPSELLRWPLPDLRAEARRVRLARFGRTVALFAPLYISNRCINACRYCDFSSRHHTLPRITLSLDEIRREGEAIAATGIRSLLIVAGEDPRHVTLDYLCALPALLGDRFESLSLEVAPQSEEAYRALFAAGYQGLTCFQETYDRALYPTLHPVGPKHDFAWRLGTQLRAGRAGFRTLGLAFLMGLRDWHSEAEALAAHARMLMKTCWQARIQFAFPRIRPVDGGFIPAAPVDDETLERLMLAFRIAFPEASITLSTREAPAFRDRMAELCADTLSAGSHVTPGGYAHPTDQTAQFSLADTRSAADVIAALRARHLDPIFKQWA